MHFRLYSASFPSRFLANSIHILFNFYRSYSPWTIFFLLTFLSFERRFETTRQRLFFVSNFPRLIVSFFFFFCSRKYLYFYSAFVVFVHQPSNDRSTASESAINAEKYVYIYVKRNMQSVFILHFCCNFNDVAAILHTVAKILASIFFLVRLVMMIMP